MHFLTDVIWNYYLQVNFGLSESASVQMISEIVHLSKGAVLNTDQPHIIISIIFETLCIQNLCPIFVDSFQSLSKNLERNTCIEFISVQNCTFGWIGILLLQSWVDSNILGVHTSREQLRIGWSLILTYFCKWFYSLHVTQSHSTPSLKCQVKYSVTVTSIHSKFCVFNYFFRGQILKFTIFKHHIFIPSLIFLNQKYEIMYCYAQRFL